MYYIFNSYLLVRSSSLRIERTIESYKSTSNQLDSQIDKVSQEVTNFSQELCDLIKKKEQSLLDELKQIKQNQTNKFKEYVDLIQQSMDEINGQLLKIDHVRLNILLIY